MVCIQYKNRDTEKIVFSLKVKLKCPTNQVWKGKDLQAKAMSTAYVVQTQPNVQQRRWGGGEGGGGGKQTKF